MSENNLIMNFIELVCAQPILYDKNTCQLPQKLSEGKNIGKDMGIS